MQSTTPTRRVILDAAIERSVIRGTLTAGDERRAFHGWLELNTALEATLDLQAGEPGVGPRVDAVSTVDGANSTGIFASAQGRGDDTAYPTQSTAAPQGTVTLAP
jgi:hypothetical protein